MGSACVPNAFANKGLRTFAPSWLFGEGLLTTGGGRAKTPAMSAASRFVARKLAALGLAVLCLVPAVLSGHHHDAEAGETRTECSVCIVTSHAPAAAPARVAIVTAATRSLPVLVFEAPAPARIYLHRALGRAPPSGNDTSFA